MRIGELAAASGASVRSLRYYEQQGLIAAERTSSGQRRFAPGTAVRVTLIRTLLTAGLSTATIAEVLPCVHDPDQRTPWLDERLKVELTRIDEQLSCLQRTRTTLLGVMTEYRTEPN